MARIDLDAARVARREARGESPVVVFGGEDFTFPVEMPMKIVAMMTQDITPVVMLEVVEEFLGAEQYARFMGHQPSPDDISELVKGLMDSYGMSAGESEGSE